MFERFTDQARRVIVHGQEESRLLRHAYIGTEHLLLGLLHDDGGEQAGVLAGMGVTLSSARRQVEESRGPGQRRATRSHPLHGKRETTVGAVGTRVGTTWS